MLRFITFSFLLTVLAGNLGAQYNPRTVPEGTRLENGMVSPIYVETLDPAGDTPLMRVQLKDSTGYRLTLYAERALVYSDTGDAKKRLTLYLHQSPRKTGTVAIEAKSKQEKTLITALSVGLEHYTPGWTKNWSMAGHRELKALVTDLRTRQFSRD